MVDLVEAGREVRERFELDVPPLEQVRRRAMRSQRRRRTAAGLAVVIPVIVVASMVALLSSGSQAHTRVVAGGPLIAGAQAVQLRPVECSFPPAAATAEPGTVTLTTCTQPDATRLASTPSLALDASRPVLLDAKGTADRFVLGPADLRSIPATVAVVSAPGGGFDVQISFTGHQIAALLPDIQPRPGQTSPHPFVEEAIEANGVVVALVDLRLTPQPAGVFEAVAPTGRPFTRQAAQQLVQAIGTPLRQP